MTERGIARDGYKVLDDTGARDRICDQRIARAVPEEKYRVGLRAAGVRGDIGTSGERWKFAGRAWERK
jgi:hypothetical protein